MLKYLRITVTALSLTASVLLIALWVRSYRSIDLLCCPIPGAHSFEIQSKHGWLGYGGCGTQSGTSLYIPWMKGRIQWSIHTGQEELP